MIRSHIKALLGSILIASSSSAFQPTIYAGAGVPAAGGGGGSFTFVASASGASDGSSTTVATSSTLNVATGDLLIALVTYEDTGTTTVAITDGVSNSFTYDSGDEATDSTFIFVSPLYRTAGVANATATFTATLGAARPYKRIVVMQFRPGSGETVSKDISGTREAASVGAAITTGTFSTTGTDGVVCGVAGIYTSGTWSADTINSVAADDAATEQSAHMWCRIVTAGLTTVTGAATYSALSTWAATAIAFKAE